jgi:hypothetical protein
MSINLKPSVLKKYYDAKLIITDINNETKSYDIHKLMLSNYCDFFEMLFDNENKQEYMITIPFEIAIFDIIFNQIYNINNEKIEEDLNYYENMLYALYYLQFDKESIRKHLNKIIQYIEFNYDDKKIIDTTIFFSNLNKFNLMDEELKKEFIERLTYDKFIENYYDPEKKKLVLTAHCGLDCFEKFEKSIEIEGIIFSVYNTVVYDVEQMGFWLNYEKNKEYTGERTIQKGKGKVEIYSGIDYYKYKLGHYTSSKNRYDLIFDNDKNRNRHGHIIELRQMSNPIDSIITFYKITVEFE